MIAAKITKVSKRLSILLALCALALSSCVMRPRGVLSNKEMENLLVDLHSAEGILQVAGYNYGHTDDCNAYYALVLEKHGVTQAEFDSSIVWYTAHPQYFQRVYPKVIERLQAHQEAEVERLKLLSAEMKLRDAEEAERLRELSARPDADAVRHAFLYPAPVRLYQLDDTLTLCTDSLWQQMYQLRDSLATDSLSVDSLALDTLSVDTLFVKMDTLQ